MPSPPCLSPDPDALFAIISIKPVDSLGRRGMFMLSHSQCKHSRTWAAAENIALDVDKDFCCMMPLSLTIVKRKRNLENNNADDVINS